MAELEDLLEASVVMNERKSMQPPPPTQALAIVRTPEAQRAVDAMIARAELTFTPEQEQMIRDSFANGAAPGEFQMLMGIAKARRLNPLLKQIHFVNRYDSEKERKVWSAQVSIDGLRAIAERTGKYDGQDEPEFEYDAKGGLTLARVKIYRKDWSRPAVGVARFSEYCQRKRDGHLTRMWAEKSHIMISKCAEALGFRKAFPEDTSGLYVPEEMGDVGGSDEPRAKILPHIDPDQTGDERPTEGGPYADIMRRLGDLEASIDVLLEPEARLDFHVIVSLRADLGASGKPSQLLKDIQVGKEQRTLVPSEWREINRCWTRTNRKLQKLEAAAPQPDAADSFADPSDEEIRAGLDMREPGSDG